MQSHAYETFGACGKAAAVKECDDNKRDSTDNKNNKLYNWCSCLGLPEDKSCF